MRLIMTKFKILLVLMIIAVFLSGCANNTYQNSTATNTVENTTESTKSSDVIDNIEPNINGITVEEILAQIPDTINNELYYNGNSFDSQNMFYNKNLILNKHLEFDLYSNYRHSYSPMVQLIFTNAEYITSTPEEPEFYSVGICVTETGLQSDFFFGYSMPASEKPGEYLGSYSMCIEEIYTPTHEKMSDEWKERAANSIRIFMDENNYSSIAEENLEIGKYKVYVQGFSENDEHTNIFFEHENGSIYNSCYRFVHDTSGTRAANLFKFGFRNSIDSESFRIYYERVKQNAALTLEYEVHQRPGR